jgi:hypothetical protein
MLIIRVLVVLHQVALLNSPHTDIPADRWVWSPSTKSLVVS